MWNVLQLWCDDLKFDPGRAFACWNCRRTHWVIPGRLEFQPPWELHPDPIHPALMMLALGTHRRPFMPMPKKKTQDQLKSLQSGQTFAFRELSGSQAEQLPVSSACWEMLGNVGKILGTYFQTLTLTGSDRL